MDQTTTQSYYPVEPKPPVKAHQPTPTVIDGTNWTMLIHLSQLAHCVVPFGGILAPILIWQLKKEEHPQLDQHGKMIFNWMISQFLYTCIAGILAIFIVGVPILIVLGIISVVFPIIGALKAADGLFWKYPMTIEFLK